MKQRAEKMVVAIKMRKIFHPNYNQILEDRKKYKDFTELSLGW